MLGRFGLIAIAALALSACNGGAAREVMVTGSSTVFPFTKAVADAFVKEKADRKAPAIEPVGTGAGFEKFCAGAGFTFPDVANASRRMRRAEFDKCKANGVGDIIEAVIGLDGIALAESNDGPKLQLTRKDIYLALAANPNGKPNAAKTWQDVNPALPAIPILVMGPSLGNGTRDAFVELILEPGCFEATPAAKELKDSALATACHNIRADGAYVEKGEDDNLIVKGLEENSNALGLFGYSYLEENAAKLHGVSIDGVVPDYSTISTGKYPGVRSLYLYVKKANLEAVPGLKDFVALYTTMWNPNGPLTKHGLIAAPDKVRARSKEALTNGFTLDVSALP